MHPSKLFVILCFIQCTACFPPAQPAQSDEGKVFYVADPNQLYFENLRAFHYNLERGPEPRLLNVYSHKNFSPKQAKLPPVFPVIVMNWLEDEAHIQFNQPGQEKLNTDYFIRVEGDREIIISSEPDKKGWRTLAFQIYEHLRNNRTVQWSSDGDQYQSYLSSEHHRRAYLQTIEDFKKLTGSRE